jgi:hypothetical protein
VVPRLWLDTSSPKRNLKGFETNILEGLSMALEVFGS